MKERNITKYEYMQFFNLTPKIEFQVHKKPYWPGHIARTATDIPMKAHAATPPAKPSSPSVKLTPLAIEAKQNAVKTR